MLKDPPDRLSIAPASDHYDKRALDRGVEVFLNGIRQINCVAEYCVSEGWLMRFRKTALGVQVRDRYHQPVIDKVTGNITVAWR